MGKSSRGKKQRWAKNLLTHGLEQALRIRDESRLARKRNNLLKGNSLYITKNTYDKNGAIISTQNIDRFSSTAKKLIS